MATTDGTVEQLVLLAGDGALDARYNVVLVAEGYRQADAALFVADAQAMGDALLATKPFGGLAGSINLFRLDVWSVQAGADRGPLVAATYFDARFDASTSRLLRCDEVLVAETVQRAFADAHGAEAHAHKVVVVVNTPYYGGSGGIDAGVCVTSRKHGASTLLHELGHLFGLVDEYDTVGADPISNPPPPFPQPPSVPRAPNLSMSCVRDELPWADLVAATTPLPTDGHHLPALTIGAFRVDDQGADSFRPQWQCRMRHTVTPTFCAVCARHIEATLHAAL